MSVGKESAKGTQSQPLWHESGPLRTCLSLPQEVTREQDHKENLGSGAWCPVCVQGWNVTQNMALKIARLQAAARGQGYQLEPCGFPAQLCCQGSCLAMQMGTAEIPTEIEHWLG